MGVKTYPATVEYTPEFVEANLKLVHHVCKKFTYWANGTPGVEYNDLVSVGYIGLISAIKKFDPTMGFKFSTYAVPMIYGEIRRFKRDYSEHTVKVPRSIRECYSGLVKNDLWYEDNEIISQIIPFSVKTIEDTKRYYTSRTFSSLESTAYSSDGEDISLSDTIGETCDFDTSLVLREFMGTLSEKEQYLIKLRLNGFSQAEIADKVGISQVQVSRLLNKVEAKALAFHGMEKGDNEMGRVAKGDTKEAKRLIKETTMSAREIAEATNCNPNTIRQYIYTYRDGSSTKKSNSKSSECLTRSLTDEEKVRYGVVDPEPPNDVEDISVPNTPMYTVVSRVPTIIPPLEGDSGLNISLSVTGESVTLEKMEEQFNRIMAIVRSTGLKTVTFKMEIN